MIIEIIKVRHRLCPGTLRPCALLHSLLATEITEERKPRCCSPSYFGLDCIESIYTCIRLSIEGHDSTVLQSGQVLQAELRNQFLLDIRSNKMHRKFVYDINRLFTFLIAS